MIWQDDDIKGGRKVLRDGSDAHVCAGAGEQLGSRVTGWQERECQAALWVKRGTWPYHRKYAFCSNSQYLEGGATFLAWTLYCCEDAVKGRLRVCLKRSAQELLTPMTPAWQFQPSLRITLVTSSLLCFSENKTLHHLPSIIPSVSNMHSLQLIFQFICG